MCRESIDVIFSSKFQFKWFCSYKIPFHISNVESDKRYSISFGKCATCVVLLHHNCLNLKESPNSKQIRLLSTTFVVFNLLPIMHMFTDVQAPAWIGFILLTWVVSFVVFLLHKYVGHDATISSKAAYIELILSKRFMYFMALVFLGNFYGDYIWLTDIHTTLVLGCLAGIYFLPNFYFRVFKSKATLHWYQVWKNFIALPLLFFAFFVLNASFLRNHRTETLEIVGNPKGLVIYKNKSYQNAHGFRYFSNSIANPDYNQVKLYIADGLFGLKVLINKETILIPTEDDKLIDKMIEKFMKEHNLQK